MTPYRSSAVRPLMALIRYHEDPDTFCPAHSAAYEPPLTVAATVIVVPLSMSALRVPLVEALVRRLTSSQAATMAVASVPVAAVVSAPSAAV